MELGEILLKTARLERAAPREILRVKVKGQPAALKIGQAQLSRRGCINGEGRQVEIGSLPPRFRELAAECSSSAGLSQPGCSYNE